MCLRLSFTDTVILTEFLTCYYSDLHDFKGHADF